MTCSKSRTIGFDVLNLHSKLLQEKYPGTWDKGVVGPGAYRAPFRFLTRDCVMEAAWVRGALFSRRSARFKGSPNAGSRATPHFECADMMQCPAWCG